MSLMMRKFLALVVAACSFTASAELLAGTGKADITPPTGGPMYGYGARGANVSQGVHDRLYAKALVLQNGDERIAIATLDWGTITQESSERIRKLVKKETGIENVVCAVSHTHSAPGLDWEFPSKRKPYIKVAEVKIANAIIAAVQDLQPARVGVGHGEVREGHNRRKVLPDGTVEMFWTNRDRVPTSPLDYSLGVIRVETTGGDTIATLVNFQCHPVVLGPENLHISADYPGVLTRVVEESLGGQCMFLQGAAGNINPFWDKTPPDEGAYEQVAIMGKAVADEVIRVTTEAKLVEEDPMLSFHTEIVPLAHRDDPERKKSDLMAEVNTMLIGRDIAIATFPGEFFLEHGVRLKNESKIEHTFFVGYTNRRLRYFPTIQACAEGGYGAASATIVEVGAGERLVGRALINLYYQAGLIRR